MREKGFYEIFKETSEKIVIDEKKKEKSLSCLREVISCKRPGILHSNKQIVYSQVRYMDKSMLVLHVGICVAILLFLIIMDLYDKEEKTIILFSTILSAFLGLISIFEISRIFFSGIAELSESCYFNVRQIVALHMVFSGIINLLILSVGILFVGMRWKISFLQIGLYVFVPFIFTQCCCLKVMISEAGRKNSYLLLMVGAFLITFYMAFASSPVWYRITALGVWGTFLIVGMMTFVLQVRDLFRKIEKGDIICMN